jgi:hypothetical protein
MTNSSAPYNAGFSKIERHGGMILKVLIDEQTYRLEVPDQVLDEAEDYFRKLDADMDRGWQMSRDWVEKPDIVQRCRIVADRLLTALEAQRKPSANLMAAYILKRLPGVQEVRIDAAGDMNATEFGPHPG